MKEVKPEEQRLSWEPHIKEEPEFLHIKEEPESPHIKEELESPHIKEEPEESPFHTITVKTEEDQDKASVLQQRPTEEKREEAKDETGDENRDKTDDHSGSSEDPSDTDRSEDCSQEQAPKNKRSYAMTVRDYRPFSCSECALSFRDKSRLQTHMSVHSEEKPHKCSVCEKKFRLNYNLLRHTKIHTGDKPFVCSVCKRAFVLKSHLSRHQRVLHHVCPVCSKRFAESKSLNEHLKDHAEEGTLSSSSVLVRDTDKPLSCLRCGRTFKMKKDLLHHMSVHRGERDFLPRHFKLAHFICPVCHQQFSDKDDLEEHQWTHEEANAELFSCLDCGRTFRLIADLLRHKKSH